MALLRRLLMISPFLLCSCALTRDYVAIDYVPIERQSVVDAASNIEVHVRVVDHREDTEAIGHKKNGYGMKLAPIIATNRLEDLLLQAITAELAERGFVLTQGEGFLVDVELKKFYNKFKTGLFTADSVAEVIFTAKVLSPAGEELFNEEILGRDKKGFIFNMGASNAKLVLEKALTAAVEKIMANEDFLAALSIEPQQS